MKYALRPIRRSPGFAAIAVLTLALGLGATTAVFSIVNAVLLEPMKYRDAGRLYVVWTVPPPSAKTSAKWPVNARQFDRWRKGCKSCDDVAMIFGAAFTVKGNGEPERIPGLQVTYNFLHTLGVRPALGRDFRPEEELAANSHEVILTDALWRSRFSADPAVIGRKLIVNGEATEVIGVLPAALRIPAGSQWKIVFANADTPLMFSPIGVDVTQGPVDRFRYVSIARLREGVAPARAAEEMYGLIGDFVHDKKLEEKIALTPLKEQLTGSVQRGLWLLLGAVGALLLIVCVNVGNLMLARASSRDREAGVRLALGASRGQVVGLVLTEALLLTAIGSALGLVAAYGGLKALVAAAPAGIPRLDEVQVSWPVLAFAAIAAALSTLLCAILPAWRMARIEPQESIRVGASHSTDSGAKLRMRQALVTVEAALSTVLLVAGGLLMSSLIRLVGVDKGFAAERVMVQDFSLVNPKYTDAAKSRFIENALRAVAEVPGVRSAGMINAVPLRGEMSVCALIDTNQPRTQDPALANFRFVSPDYWRTMGIAIKSGRGIEDGDRGRLTAVVSERAARTLWPGENPIGKHVESCGGSGEPADVVGVAADVRMEIEKAAPATVYQAYWTMSLSGGSFVVRTAADSAGIIPGVHAALRKTDPDLPIAQTRTMEDVLDSSLAARRFEMYLAVAFALAALGLASLGMYGVISFTVMRRTPELGIRIALGAATWRVVAMVLRQGMIPVVIGVVLGLGGALAAGGLISSELYGVTPRNPVVLATVAIVLAAVAVCACWVPALKASRVDPVRALRSE